MGNTTVLCILMGGSLYTRGFLLLSESREVKVPGAGGRSSGRCSLGGFLLDHGIFPGIMVLTVAIQKTLTRPVAQSNKFQTATFRWPDIGVVEIDKMGVPCASVGIMARPARSAHIRDMKAVVLKGLVGEDTGPPVAAVAELVLERPFSAVGLCVVSRKEVSIGGTMGSFGPSGVIIVMTIRAFYEA